MKKFISSILAVSMLMPVMSVSATTLEAQSVLDTSVEENNEMLDAIRRYKTEKIGVECTEENCSINCEPINDTYVYAEITLNGVDCDAVRVVKRSADGIWLQELGDLERVVYGNGNIYTAVELFEQDKLTFEEFKKAGGAYYCDINGNDIVDVNDVTQLQLFLSQGKADEEDELATMYYDVTLEGYIDVSDVTKIQMYLAGYEDIPCYGHNVVTQGYKEPTCSTEGYTGDKYCSVCNKKLSSGKVIAVVDHTPGSTKNAKKATCTAKGYTGDKYCKYCNILISKGKSIAATGHQHTEIRNAKKATTTSTGYTGDTYCKDCNTLISKGETIAKLPSTPNNSGLSDIEQSILKDMNEARKKEGLKPLKWDAELYPAVKIRTN